MWLMWQILDAPGTQSEQTEVPPLVKLRFWWRNEEEMMEVLAGQMEGALQRK